MGLTHPVCSSFSPTILEGQLCYKLMVNMTSGQGKANELMLLLDYNEDRSLQTSSKNEKDVKVSKETLNLDTAVESVQGISAKIHINTLSPYIGFGGGTYTMSVVKRMTAKDDFVQMPLKDRSCEVELYENCRTRELLKECNCVPWEMPGYQVKLHQKPTTDTNHPCRTWANAAPWDGYALRITSVALSIAVLLVKESFLMSTGLRSQLKKRWKMKQKREMLKWVQLRLF